MLVCIAHIGGEMVSGLRMMADPLDLAIKVLSDRVLVLVMVCKRTDLQAEAAFGAAWSHFDRVILTVPVPCHLKDFFWAEGGAETATDAEAIFYDLCNYRRFHEINLLIFEGI